MEPAHSDEPGSEIVIIYGLQDTIMAQIPKFFGSHIL